MRDYRTLKLLFIFWTFAFLVNSLRAHAVGELPFHLAGGHRLAAFAFAATMAFLLTRMLEKTDSVRARMIASGAALSIMPLAHSLFLKASCAMAPNEGVAPMTYRECVVQALIVTGYFAAWIAIHFALTYHQKWQDLQKSLRRIDLGNPVPENDDPSTGPSRDGSTVQAFWATNGCKHLKLRAEDIQWVEAQGDYALLHASGSSGMMRRTLAQWESGLGPNFIRVHRSAVVRREAIVSVTRRQNGALSLTLKDGSSVPAGRSYVRGLGELRKRV